MTVVLMQLSPPERLDAIQTYLNRQGSSREFLLTVLALIAVLLLVLVLHRVQIRARRGDLDKPGRLFQKLVRDLSLSVPQRDLLRRMARDLGLQHATILLLGRRLFESHARQWQETGRAKRPEDQRRLRDLADTLFPSTAEAAASANTGPSTSGTALRQ